WGAPAALVPGEFLEGFAVPGAPEFEHWLTAERSLWRERAVDALARHAEQLLSRGHATAATEAARLALRLDDTSQVAAGVLMRSPAPLGGPARAPEAPAAPGTAPPGP